MQVTYAFSLFQEGSAEDVHRCESANLVKLRCSGSGKGAGYQRLAVRYRLKLQCAGQKRGLLETLAEEHPPSL